MAPDALGDAEPEALLAEADCVALFCGLLRAALALSARAVDCAAALLMDWLFSARACPAITLEAAEETDGEKSLLAPEAAGALEAL